MLVSEYNYEMDMAVQREESREQGLKEAMISSIKNLMETMNLSLEQAMNALKIPEIERQNYMNELKQK